MVEAGGGFRFQTKPLKMRFGRPLTKTDHFQRHCAVETFLSRAINYSLTASANFLPVTRNRPGLRGSPTSAHFPWQAVLGLDRRDVHPRSQADQGQSGAGNPGNILLARRVEFLPRTLGKV